MPINTVDEKNFISKKASVKIVMGELTISERFRLIWWIIMGKIVTFGGNTVMSTRHEGVGQL